MQLARLALLLMGVPAVSVAGDSVVRPWTVERLTVTNHAHVLWENFPAEAFYLCPNAKHLYLLTYVALYRLNTTNLAVERTYRIPYANGTGMLSLSESPNCQQLAVYQMPGRVLLLEPGELASEGSCSIEISDYITRLRWGAEPETLLALGDRGYLAKIAAGRTPKVIATHKLEGDHPMGWDLGGLAGGTAYITYSDAGFITRYSITDGRLLAPIRPSTDGTPEGRGARSNNTFSFGQVAIDTLSGHLFVQKPRTFGTVPPKDALLVIKESDGRVLQQREVPIGIVHLQKARDNTFVFFGQNGPGVVIYAINPGTLAWQKCAEMKCSDFQVSENAGLLYYALYKADTAEIGLLRLTMPDARGSATQSEGQETK